MNIKSALLVPVAAVLPLLATAAETPPPYQMDAATLGRLDALLTACAKADAKNRSTYERYRTEMIVFGEGTPYEVRAPGSDTLEYKQAHAEGVELAGKASREELVEQCSRMIGLQTEAGN